MEVRIPSKYLKGEEPGYISKYVINPPANMAELDGYVMKIEMEEVSVIDDSIIIRHGNEWNKKNREYCFMFEKEAKVKGQSFKRYRYTEEEFYMLYGREASDTFDERLEARKKKFQGSGKLIRAQFTAYKERMLKTSADWFISSDMDETWVYEFTYDIIRDIGKHSCNAKGFSVLEEYKVEDISVLIEAKSSLLSMLHQLDHIQNLKIGSLSTPFVYDKYGTPVKTDSPGEAIALIAYDSLLPAEVKATRESYGTFENPEAAEVRKQLTEMGMKMEIACGALIDEYRSAHLEIITKKIKELIGITIPK